MLRSNDTPRAQTGAITLQYALDRALLEQHFMHFRGIVVGACLLSLLAGVAHADGRLDRARKASEGTSSSSASSSSRRSSSSHHHRHHHHHHDEDDDDGFWLINGIAYAIGAMSSIPAAYAPYPYATSLGAYSMPSELDVAVAPIDPVLDARLAAESTRIQTWGGQLALDGGYFAGITRSNVDLRLLTPTRWEFGARSSFMIDPKSEENYAMLAGVTFGYRLADLHWLMLRLLFGVRYFGDFHGGVGGVDGGIGFDLFIAKPVVLSASITGGGVGAAGLVEARAQLGVMLSRLELFGGFSYLNIGGVNLHSPVLGVRLWL